MASLSMLDTVQAFRRKRWEYQQPVPPLGGKYWGERLTEYGGIGGFPFLGQRRVRDLYVSRSHRHFGNGVSKSTTYNQPYRLTDLKRSECRINDDRLPAPLDSGFNKVPKQQQPWPDHHPYYSHRSKFEVFPDVKPPRETGESISSGQSSVSTTHSSSYDDALRRLHHKLYHTSLYQDSYRGHAMQSKTPRTTMGLDSIPSSWQLGEGTITKGGGLLGGNRADADRDDNFTNDGEREEDKEGEEQEEEGENEEDDDEQQTTGDEAIKENDLESSHSDLRSILISESDRSGSVTSKGRLKSSKSRSTLAKRSVSFNDVPQVKILESRDSNSTGEMTSLPGTGPCWPPSTSLVVENIRGSQLLERSDITQPLGSAHQVAPLPAPSGRVNPQIKMASSAKVGEPLTPLHHPHPPANQPPSKLPSVPRPAPLTSGSSLAKLRPASARSDSPQFPATKVPRGSEALFPSSEAQLYGGKQQNQPFLVPATYRIKPIRVSPTLSGISSLRSSNPVRKLQEEMAKRILLRKGDGVTPLVLPPAPLSECLSPPGSQVPHRLGLRFKTEAHQRYQIMHPDPTPDLRSTRNSGRRCFFNGYHSSVYRG